ncbi:hemerythrin domain-containing protein [Sphingobium sp.]|uniref:hemerythrin domain-containing protein n=1 Tax=Sphingobium sp. TaxID=1912891 RepID=UPI003BB5430D
MTSTIDDQPERAGEPDRIILVMIDHKQLTDEHNELGAIALQLRGFVTRQVADIEAVTRERWRLGYRLAIHLAREDRHVYPELKRHTDAQIAAMATTYEAEMGNLDQQYRDYMARWNSDGIIAKWDSFCDETLAILEALENRIAREEKNLYPLLGRTGKAPMPARQ